MIESLYLLAGLAIGAVYAHYTAKAELTNLRTVNANLLDMTYRRLGYIPMKQEVEKTQEEILNTPKDAATELKPQTLEDMRTDAILQDWKDSQK